MAERAVHHTNPPAACSLAAYPAHPLQPTQKVGIEAEMMFWIARSCPRRSAAAAGAPALAMPALTSIARDTADTCA
jgi:hypothetical protein